MTKFLLALSILVMASLNAQAQVCSSFPGGLSENDFTDKASITSLKYLLAAYQVEGQKVHQVAFFEQTPRAGQEPNCEMGEVESQFEVVYVNADKACIQTGRLIYRVENSVEKLEITDGSLTEPDCRSSK